MRCPRCGKSMQELQLTSEMEFSFVVKAKWECHNHGKFLEKQPELLHVYDPLAQPNSTIAWDYDEV